MTVSEEIIEFRFNSWMENAGICGLINILETNQSDFEILPQSVRVPLHSLEQFEEQYFTYFANIYRKQSNLTKILAYKEILVKNEQDEFSRFTDKDYVTLQKYLSDLKRYGESNSYKAVYELIDTSTDILGLIKHAKIDRLKKDEIEKNREAVITRVQAVYQILKQIYAYYEREDVQHYLPAKIQIYSVINKGYKDVSFLNSQESKGDFYEKYHNYFVEPIFDYLEESHEKDKMNCTNCGRSIKKGEISFSFLNQAGYDANRKQSNAWDFNNDLYMCPICRLLYTCIPAGFTYVFTQGIFVNDNHSVKNLVRVNRGIRDNVLALNMDDVKTTNIYAALIRTLQIESTRQMKREFADIQVVRYENERYYFNLLPKKTLRTFNTDTEKFQQLFKAGYLFNGDYHSLYQEVVSCLMNNTNLFSLLYRVLRLKTTNDSVYANASHFLAMIDINQNFLKELVGMRVLNWYSIMEIREEGEKFKRAYGNEKKPKSIGLRLLNALKANDKDGFMNTLLNSYMYLGRAVPQFFNEVFLDDERFKTIGYTFVSGIIDGQSTDKGGKEDE